MVKPKYKPGDEFLIVSENMWDSDGIFEIGNKGRILDYESRDTWIFDDTPEYEVELYDKETNSYIQLCSLSEDCIAVGNIKTLEILYGVKCQKTKKKKQKKSLLPFKKKLQSRT